MRADIDTSEVARFADELRDIAPETARRIAVETESTVQVIAAGARARAPRRRPWLSTSEGIVTDMGVVGGQVEGSVFSPRDERGESVGYRQEFGTSEQSPQPFLLSAFRPAAARYYLNVGRIVDQELAR